MGFNKFFKFLIKFDKVLQQENDFKYFSSSLGNPHSDPNAEGDAFKTLFVGRVVSNKH